MQMSAAGEKERMRLQIEQITSLLDAAYAGLVRNLKLTWEYDWDDRRRGFDSPYSAKIKADHEHDYGRHTRIDFDTPCYWGHMSGDLVERAYHWRERLIDKVDDDKRARAAARMNEEYGQEIRQCRR